MIVKQQVANENLVLSICDEELVGKVIEEGNMQLDLSSDFFKGDKMEQEELKLLLEKAYIINAVGKKSVDFLVEQGFVEEDKVGVVEGVPHAQMVRF